MYIPTCPLPQRQKWGSDKTIPTCPLPQLEKWGSDKTIPTCPLPQLEKWGQIQRFIGLYIVILHEQCSIDYQRERNIGLR